MTNQNQNQKDNFPFKLSPVGWIIFLILLLTSFYAYYTDLYGMVSQGYREKVWSASRAYLQDDKNATVLRVNVPKTIADFTDSEIRVQGWNSGITDKNLRIVIDAQVYDNDLSAQMKTEQTKDCYVVNTNQPFVYVSAISPFSKDEVKGEFGTSTFNLEIPPHGSANTNLWIVLQLNSELEDNMCVVIQFFEIHDAGVQGNMSDCENDEISKKMICLVKFDDNQTGKFVVRFNRQETLSRYVIENFLVPPWFNAIILFICWFVAWLLDILITKPKNAS